MRKRRRCWSVWTAEELDRLKALRLEGTKTVKQIAAEIGRPRAAIRYRLQQLGVYRFKARRSEWVRVLTSFHMIDQVAELMGVGRRAVKETKRRLRRAGVLGVDESRAANAVTLNSK